MRAKCPIVNVHSESPTSNGPKPIETGINEIASPAPARRRLRAVGRTSSTIAALRRRITPRTPSENTTVCAKNVVR
jgi:hypothetical protein